MAAIDKIYVDNWEQYKMFKDWCDEQPKLVDKYGVKVSISTYLYKQEEGFVGERSVMCAPYYVDAYLIRNCPFDFIQYELKCNYGDEYYEDIKNGKLYATPYTSDKYEFGKHFKCVKHPSHFYNTPLGCKRWFVDVSVPEDCTLMWYHENHNSWDFCDEFVESMWTSSCAFCNTIRALKRLMIKKWKLPIGTKVVVTAKYVGDYYEFIIKK